MFDYEKIFCYKIQNSYPFNWEIIGPNSVKAR